MSKAKSAVCRSVSTGPQSRIAGCRWGLEDPCRMDIRLSGKFHHITNGRHAQNRLCFLCNTSHYKIMAVMLKNASVSFVIHHITNGCHAQYRLCFLCNTSHYKIMAVMLKTVSVSFAIQYITNGRHAQKRLCFFCNTSHYKWLSCSIPPVSFVIHHITNGRHAQKRLSFFSRRLCVGVRQNTGQDSR